MQFPMLATDIVDPFQRRLYDIKGKLPLYFKMTFLHMPCSDLGVTFNGETVHGDDFSGYTATEKRNNKKKANKNLTVKRYKPRSIELRTIFGSENSREAKKHQGRGCTLVGNMKVPLVAGNLAITMTRDAWVDAINYIQMKSGNPKEEGRPFAQGDNFNSTHYIHEVRFGKKRSVAKSGVTASGYVPPLEDRLRKIENDFFAIGREEIHVKLIPTVHSNPGLFSSIFGGGNRPFYQMSVVEHLLRPETMMTQASGVSLLPGVVMTYDVTPLAVHIDELDGDGGFLGFLSSLIGIVGGCFVTVGLFASCAVRSVEAVAKKID